MKCLSRYSCPAVSIAVCRELVLDGYVLPKGTLLSVPSYLVHRHPDAYPEPEEFMPDRWLSDGEPRRTKLELCS